VPKRSYPYQNLFLKDLKGEFWDDIPSLDGACEISNFGRVKSKRRFVERGRNGGFWKKEKILKPRKSVQIVSEGKRKLYRLSANISFEGKKHTCSVARMVYYLFVKKFDLNDRKIKVSTKDEDPFHIRPGNLFLTSTDVYMKKAYELKRRKRESFGNPCRTVSQYDLKGRWLNSYPSISVAAQSSKVSSGHILKSINESEGVASGYIWRFGNEKSDLPKIPKRVPIKIASHRFHSTPVSCYDLKGRKIKEYRNVKTASKSLGIQPNSIRKVIIGDSITARECYWILGSGPQKISLSAINNKIRETKINIWRPVTQYALNGDRIKSYDSITQAAEATGLHNMNISGALRSKAQRTAGGFLWIYGRGDAKIKIKPTIRRKRELQELYVKQVTQYSLKGNRIAIHNSLKQAAEKQKIAPSFLVDAVTGKAMSYAGFYWRLGKGAAFIKQTPRADAERKRLKKLSKPVLQFDLSGKKLGEYPSIGEASRQTKTSASQIRMVALGKYQSSKCSIWKFKK
jgi:hypothetical protein